KMRGPIVRKLPAVSHVSCHGPSPSPLYSGERAGVRGSSSSSGAEAPLTLTRSRAVANSPRFSPEYRGEGTGGARAIGLRFLLCAIALVMSSATGVAQDAPAKPKPAKLPYPYVWGKAYRVRPDTHNHESGYFSLCEGLDGRIYVGTAKYGENAYLVESDPKNEKQSIVI